MFSHIVLNDVVNPFLFLINDVNSLMCDVVVAASCLISSDKKELNNAWHCRDSVDDLLSAFGAALECSNTIPYIPLL